MILELGMVRKSCYSPLRKCKDEAGTHLLQCSEDAGRDIVTCSVEAEKIRFEYVSVAEWLSSYQPLHLYTAQDKRETSVMR